VRPHQHASLTPERWSTFSLDQQILMIANEMNRASKLFAGGDRERLLGCYERALRGPGFHRPTEAAIPDTASNARSRSNSA